MIDENRALGPYSRFRNTLLDGGGESLYFASPVIANPVFCNCLAPSSFFSLLFSKDFILEENWHSAYDIYYATDARNDYSFSKSIGETATKFSRLTIAVATAIVLSFSMANASAAQPISLAANDIMQKTEEAISDTWITSKVKSSLIVNKNVSGVDIKVEASKGVIPPSGNMKNDAERDLAIETTRGVKGVKAVSAGGLKSVG